MKYERIIEGIFVARPNRFIAMVNINGIVETCHVKNTGRCRELLREGVPVLVQEMKNTKRKTRYDLISVWKGERLVNIDSQAPNVVFKEWLLREGYFPELKTIRSEKRYGNSRFDYFLETADRHVYVEVKGVTLEENGVARFPDAPTERGTKHLKELIRCMEEGYRAVVAFVIQMKGVSLLRPNDDTDPEFGLALREAHRRGVEIIALDCEVGRDEIVPGELVKVDLSALP